MNSVPRDLDWVKAWSECSAISVMNAIRIEAKGNVEQRVAQKKRGDEWMFKFIDGNPKSFSIIREASFSPTMAIDFEVDKDSIHVFKRMMNGDVGPVISGSVGLSDDGFCRIKVGDSEMENWQFLKRALEDFFFKIS